MIYKFKTHTDLAEQVVIFKYLVWKHYQLLSKIHWRLKMPKVDSVMGCLP